MPRVCTTHHSRLTTHSSKKGNPGEIRTGVPYKNRGCARRAARRRPLGQPHLVTTYHGPPPFARTTPHAILKPVQSPAGSSPRATLARRSDFYCNGLVSTCKGIEGTVFTLCRGSADDLWIHTFGFVSLAHPELHRETNPGIFTNSHSERICVTDFRIRLSRALFGWGCP
jgi:hypothetical protein